MSDTENTTEVTKETPLQAAVSQFTDLYFAFVQDYTKFAVKGTASAVARARKALSALSKQAKPVRKELQAEKVVIVAAKKAAKLAAKANVVTE